MKYLFVGVVLLCSTSIHAQFKTSFQASAPWNPAYDIRTDIAMVYGMDSSFPSRVKSYKDRGYQIQFMTGIAWGEYQPYFRGEFDGKRHDDEAQTERRGQTIGHGKDIPYVVPTESYIAYMKTVVRRAIDGGAGAIYLEEPEFWARGGYSGAFKREWQRYYGSPWMPQDSTPEATYLSSKLKYHLYYNALKEIFAYVHTYAPQVRCFVPTHTLLNYSSWEIVSPEASLASLPGMSGYIAQVWTGTAREPNFFNGVEKERVFETAFLEYGSMLSMVAPTHRTVYFLTDPIEDRPRTWDDYKRNYEATFTAELLYPSVDHFEVMPWPNRIYLGKFKLENNPVPQPISPDYATQMQVMINALGDMPASTNQVNGSRGIGVLVGNSMMFQRFPTHDGYTDPRLSNFYGMILPLEKRGIPVETVHMENLGYPETLKHIRVLVMSYANMKPLSSDVHAALARWVASGGALVYYGRDNDPFQQVREWWDTAGKKYKAPSEELFERLGGATTHAYGKGFVYVVREDPKELVMQAGQDSAFIHTVTEAYKRPLEMKNYFQLRRGPYLLSAVMDESVSNEPLHIKGKFIDLFDPTLPVLDEKVVSPGEQSFLYDIAFATRRGASSAQARPQVLAAASRVYEPHATASGFSFLTKSPTGTNNVMRILLPARPTRVTASVETTREWDPASHTLLLRFVNNADGVRVKIGW